MMAVKDPLIKLVLHSHRYCNTLALLVTTVRTCTASQLCKPNSNSKSERLFLSIMKAGHYARILHVATVRA